MENTIIFNEVKEIIEKFGDCKIKPEYFLKIRREYPEELDNLLETYKIEPYEDNTDPTCYFICKKKEQIKLPSVRIEEYILEYIKTHYNINPKYIDFIPSETQDLENYMVENTIHDNYYIYYNQTIDSHNDYDIIIFLCEKKSGVCELKKGIEYYIGGKFTIIDRFKFEIGINKKL